LANQPVDHTAAYFALAGALGAAFLVILGNLLGAWRQRRAEADRLTQQLRAERERLDIQLAYDRRLRDLDELRRQISAVFVKSTRFIAPVIEMHELRWKMMARTSTENELLVSREREILDTLNDLRLDNMALSLLTGLHEDLVKHHAAFLDAAQRVCFAANLEYGEQGLREQSSALSDFAVVANRLVRAKFE